MVCVDLGNGQLSSVAADRAPNFPSKVYKKIAALPEAEKAAIEADLMATYAKQGKMAMVDSHRGITNLHVPSDIIIDNSMPTAIRAGGKMWNKDDKEEDFKACIPDRSYAGAFAECVEFCKKNGAFDPRTMGACPNVGLMAQKAEEYGSHPTTFEAACAGTIRIVVNGSDRVLLGHRLQKGDIWRSCQTKDAPIKDWVKLAVRRCQANDFPRNDKPCKAIFWLDPARAHDCQIMEKVYQYLPEVRTDGLDIEIMSPQQAMRVTCERAKQGLNTITVTGNVLRDYLTDLFPILELCTSAKMLSVVPMLAGGGMYETGAGGSAPKHVQQFTKENHLRWDSLGEYLALTCSIEDLAKDTRNKAAAALAAALSRAVGRFLDANKNPSRKACAQWFGILKALCSPRNARSGRSITAEATTGWPAARAAGIFRKHEQGCEDSGKIPGTSSAYQELWSTNGKAKPGQVCTILH